MEPGEVVTFATFGSNPSLEEVSYDVNDKVAIVNLYKWDATSPKPERASILKSGHIYDANDPESVVLRFDLQSNGIAGHTIKTNDGVPIK